jgi:predicted aspartyl protease
MGKVMTKMKIWNYEDEVRAKYGYITSEDVRMKEVEALVDTGATLLVLPENLVQELGLSLSGKVSVTYANGRKGKRKLARGIVVEILGRKGEFNAVVEKDD